MTLGTVALPAKALPVTAMAPEMAGGGLPIPPLTRIRQFSPSEWEDFVLEWADSLKPSYSRVEKCAGAGDMGRDIVAFASASSVDPWDNYQCKHYESALAPSTVWVELGKLAYYSFVGEYSLPRKYVFVAPRGAGNTLSKLLKDPIKLRNGLLNAWKEHCETKITKKKKVSLGKKLRAHIGSIDFSIFTSATPHELIKQHKTTSWFVYRFGGGLPARSAPPAPPTAHGTHESTYVRALLDAYEQHLGTTLATLGDLTTPQLLEHLERARHEFYSAESLKEFSKDNVPPGTFDGLLGEVHNGIADVLDEQHAHGYARVLAAVKQAKRLALTSNALVTRTSTLDRGGMCHQLANEAKVTWRR